MKRIKILNAFNLPEDQTDLPHFEINGSSQLLADGCQGVLHYDCNTVRLNCGKEVIEVCGNSLSLNHLGGDEAEVRGKIDAFRFL